MSPHTSARSTATPSQLSYLRQLALQTGTTFSPPRTRRQASCEIQRLKELRVRRGTHREVPRHHLDPAEQPYATAAHSDEISGFAATATWRSSSPPRAATARPSGVGERTELARYHVNSGERVLYGQRINGCVRITDRPASGTGRSYLVERECEQDGYSALKALVADYIEQSRKLDEVPMASSVIRRDLLQ